MDGMLVYIGNLKESKIKQQWQFSVFRFSVWHVGSHLHARKSPLCPHSHRARKMDCQIILPHSATSFLLVDARWKPSFSMSSTDTRVDGGNQRATSLASHSLTQSCFCWCVLLSSLFPIETRAGYLECMEGRLILLHILSFSHVGTG